MRKQIKKYLVIVAAVLVIIFLFQKIHWLPSFGDLFKRKPILIAETPILVKEINKLSLLSTISMYDEVVMDSSKPKNLPSFPGLRPVPDKIVLIGKGTTTAGIDLTKIDEKNIRVLKDSVSIELPRPEIQSLIMNPSDFETFDEEGKWSGEEVTQIKIRMRNKIEQRALQNKILEKAGQRAILVIDNLLRGIGFKKINVEISN
ncbi:MAG: DUF4230 domain-containing protein [Ginsengibacter sp.]